MRSSNWQYLGHVLFGTGGAFSVSGAVAFFYFQGHVASPSRYGSYSIPLLLIGVTLLIAGVTALIYSWRKRLHEPVGMEEPLPPPPPRLPPPPPPPPPS